MRRRNRLTAVLGMVAALAIAIGLLVGVMTRQAHADDHETVYCSQQNLNGVVFCYDARSMFYLCTIEPIPMCMRIAPPAVKSEDA